VSSRDEVPSPVIEAPQIKFDLPITAILYLPEIDGLSLLGNIFNTRAASSRIGDSFAHQLSSSFLMLGVHHRFDLFGESLCAGLSERCRRSNASGRQPL
jgi:hypothetical protein